MSSPVSIRDIVPVSGDDSGIDVLVAGQSPEVLRGIPESIVEAGVTPSGCALSVTTRDPGGIVADRLAGLNGLDRRRIAVVDCTASAGGPPRDGPAIYRFLDDPTDLTGIAMAVTDCLERLARNGLDHTHLVFDSLSTVFLSTASPQAVRFFHQLIVQRGFPRGCGVFPIYTNMTSDRDLERMKHVVDALIEVRRRDGTRQVRCRGKRIEESVWQALDGGNRPRGRAHFPSG